MESERDIIDEQRDEAAGKRESIKTAQGQLSVSHEAFCQVTFLFIDALSFGRGTDRQEERKSVDATRSGLNPPLQDVGNITHPCRPFCSLEEAGGVGAEPPQNLPAVAAPAQTVLPLK